MTATPTPAPSPDDISPEQLQGVFAIATEVAFVAVAAIVGFTAVAFILQRAAKQTPQAMISIILGLLTILALLGYLVTREEIAANLVATGIGAFAGALTSLFKSTPDEKASPPMSPFDAENAYKQAWKEHWEANPPEQQEPQSPEEGEQ